MSVAYRKNLRNGDNDHETELILPNDTYAEFFDDFFDSRSNEQQNVNFLSIFGIHDPTDRTHLVFNITIAG